MLDTYGGYLAGLATSILWMATSLLFTEAGKRLGVTVVNFTRLVLAVLLLGLTHRIVSGDWVPNASLGQVALLGASGVIGLAIGDQALFTSLVLVGPRVATLVMTTSPLFAALFGWVAMGETLGTVAWIGILTTVGGVAWVVSDRMATRTITEKRIWYRGIALAGVGAICQAAGLLLSKQGMGHGWLDRDCHLDPQAATLIRMVFATSCMAPFLLFGRKASRSSEQHLRPQRRRGLGRHRLRTGWAFAAMGAVAGPYLGVWMSLVATDRAPLGIAQTLCSLTPIFILPAARVIYGERIGGRAVLGTCLAIGGVGLLLAGA